MFWFSRCFCYFLTENFNSKIEHFVTSSQISTYRKLNLPLTSSIYFVFFPLEMQKRLKQTQVYHAFSYFVWKRNNGQTFKSGSCNNSVCYSHNFLQWMFFIEKLKDIAFHESLSLLLDCLKRYVAAFLEASLLQEVRISCVISAITIWC